MTRACLATLLHFDDPDDLTPETLLNFPLYRYAANYCMNHCRTASDDICKVLCLQLFVQKGNCFTNWLRVHNPYDQWRDPIFFAKNPEAASSLYYASLLGFPNIVDHLLGNGADPNLLGGKINFALQAASHQGYEEVVRQLLRGGAKIKCQRRATR